MPPSSTTRDVVVVGGGVIGLAVAERLARAGLAVTVLERSRCGGGATDAAGGMLAPLGEARSPGPFLELALESLALYPEFVRHVEAAAGREVGFRVCGKLLVAWDGPARDALDRRVSWQRQEGFAVRLLDGAGARAIEPSLSRDVLAGAHLATDALVDNRSLGAALRGAAGAAGVEIREGAPVRSLLRRGERLVGVELAAGERVSAPRVVLSAGAWSAEVGGLPAPLPVRPVRGQMLALAATAHLHGIVATPDAYLIPRATSGGSVIIVGATQEEVGFREGTDPAAIANLRRAAERAVPSLARTSEVERWSGFRPGTPDELPLLGPDPDLEGLVHATGHFRNGILLAPATAVRIERLVVRGDAAGLHPFRPDRFRRPGGQDGRERGGAP